MKEYKEKEKEPKSKKEKKSKKKEKEIQSEENSNVKNDDSIQLDKEQDAHLNKIIETLLSDKT